MQFIHSQSEKGGLKKGKKKFRKDQRRLRWWAEQKLGRKKGQRLRQEDSCPIALQPLYQQKPPFSSFLSFSTHSRFTLTPSWPLSFTFDLPTKAQTPLASLPQPLQSPSKRLERKIILEERQTYRKPLELD